MSSLSKYLRMNSIELEEEINRQTKKIASIKETISLLKKLQIAEDSTNSKQKHPVPTFTESDKSNN